MNMVSRWKVDAMGVWSACGDARRGLWVSLIWMRRSAWDWGARNAFV